MEGSADSYPSRTLCGWKTGSRAIFTVAQLPGHFELVKSHKRFFFLKSYSSKSAGFTL